MSALPSPAAALERLCRDPFTAQLLVLIAEKPGTNTKQLAARLNQTQSRASKYLARLRQAGLLTALIPKMSNQPYRWTLTGYQAPLVEPEPEPIAAMVEPEPEPIAVVPEPEIAPELESEPEAPEPVAEDSDHEDGDDEAGFSVAAQPSAKLPKGLTQADLDWHRYWHSRAVQRCSRLALMETA
jgi:hypothetical protein